MARLQFCHFVTPTWNVRRGFGVGFCLREKQVGDAGYANERNKKDEHGFPRSLSFEGVRNPLP
jgi:hypothetical protein